MIYCRKDRVLTDIVLTVLLLCGLMLFTSIPVSAQDQEIPVMAPLNPKFVDYMNLKSVPRLSIPNVTSDGYALGYIPSPLDLSHLTGQSIFPADSHRAILWEPAALCRRVMISAPWQGHGSENQLAVAIAGHLERWALWSPTFLLRNRNMGLFRDII